MKLSSLTILLAAMAVAIVITSWVLHLGADDPTLGEQQLQDALQHEKAQQKQDRVDAIIRRHRQQLADL